MNIVQYDIFGKRTIVKRDHKQRETVARILELGAGTQSSQLAEAIVEGEMPRVDFAVFADTGNEPCRLASVDIPLVVVKRPGGDILTVIRDEFMKFVSIPLYTVDASGKVGQLKRQCTSEFKIVPCDNYIKDWLIEQEYGRIVMTKTGARRYINPSIQVECIYGISYDEWERAGKRGPNWQSAEYPLIARRMTRDDCIQWLMAHNLPVPEKSSCKICPYHSNKYWSWLKNFRPAVFEEICTFDDWLRSPEAKLRFKTLRQLCYVHSSCKPLREVDFERDEMPLFLCGAHCHT